MGMPNPFDKASVLASFIEEVNSYLPEIEANLARLAQSPDSKDALEETYRRAHTISGSASMMDFPGLAHVAHGMEDILSDALEGLALLDPPTLAFLQRSFGRMQRLLHGIHDGIDENAIIAEDDDDYTQYRSMLLSADKQIAHQEQPQELPSSASSKPSLDEMLDPFRTPIVAAGVEIAWPEEPVPQSISQEPVPQGSPSAILIPTPSPQASPKAWDAVSAPMPEYPPEPLPAAEQSQEIASSDVIHTVPATSFSSIYNEMQEETHALEMQATSLKSTLTQLHMAVSILKTQHTEFVSFLDGSKDALDRMEEWAGQALGLNLRNSPEQVRRYLPLSVMWVANSKLKKVRNLLIQVTASTATTDEQMPLHLQQLRASIEACATAFQQTDQSSRTLTQAPHWETPVSRETVQATSERNGDPLTLRAAIEAQVREELRHQYEAHPTTLAARAALKQQIRNEVLQELQANGQLQQRWPPSENGETLQEIEIRVRKEMELQVRHQFLSQLVETVVEKKVALPPIVSPTEFATSTPVPAPIAVDFGEEATDIFRLEAEECLQTISVGVAALEKSPTDHELIQGIRRTTHTLKGAAGMMGFRAIADLCHISEDLLDSVMKGTTTISAAALNLLLDTTETLDILIHAGEPERTNAEAMVQLLSSRYADLLGVLASSELDSDTEIDDEAFIDSGLLVGVVADAQSTETTAQHSSRSDLSVRVRLQKLDELVNIFGELLVNRSVLKERIEHLVRLVADVTISSTRLRDVGQKLETRFESPTSRKNGRDRRGVSLPAPLQAVSENASQSTISAFIHNRDRITDEPASASHLTEFDELELDRYTEFHQLTRGLSEGTADMTTLSNEMETIIRECENVFAREGRLSNTFQDNLLRARLVPLSVMIPRLYRTARSVAFKQHKEVEFLLEGETTEVDRAVSEEIAGPLLHLVRNAVNHAIETPEVRHQKGKPAVGQIRLSATYEANQVVITVRDDGIGIDPELVRNTAIARGLIASDRILNDTEVIDLIFQPGFSTAAVLSEESGRGVGLDVVRDSVARLRGTLEVESMPGQGTAFTMRFPTSLAIQSAILVEVSGHQFAIPMLVIESIGRLDNFTRSTLAEQPAIVVRDQLYPLATLAQFLRLPTGPLDEKTPLLLVNVGGRKVALVINQVKGKMDVVLKNLGSHLRHVRGIAGGTILGNGHVVLMLELMELLPSLSDMLTSTTVSKWRKDIVPPPPVQTPAHILVVDDSPSVRRVVSDMLKQHGWQVQMARDGVEALEMITYETPAAVLLDIEMPRMDGYELMATVRAQEEYRTLPLVILTSRAATKHQQHAMQLGASACLVKPYQDEELLNTLNTLVYGAR